MTKEVETSLPVEETGSITSTRKPDSVVRICEKVPDITSQKESKNNVHFKLLVPSIAAGAIIGKGGEAITEIQNKTSTKVKMSKANDFYPGTTERVCLIIGTVESILQVFRYISEKIYEKPETLMRTTTLKGGRPPTERHKQVKILVPNSTAGIIIGKGGSFIKEVKDSSGVFIQVSQRSKELNLAERCVTIAGELSQTYDAVIQLLLKIASDPQSSSCPNISYAEVPRPVASAYPTGSPYALFMGSGFNVDGNSMPSANSESSHHLISPSSLNSLTNVNTAGAAFSPPQLNSFGPVSPVESVTDPGQVYGSSPQSLAAAMAAIGAVASTSSRRHASNSTVGRALTGRGGAATVGHQQPQTSYSLLGMVSTNSLVSGVTSPIYGPSCSSVVGSASAAGGLETVKNVLRAAGYTDIATEEIANAMHVLSVYGFISMSSLIGCSGGPNTIPNSVNNHLSMTPSPLSGYMSAGPHSPSGFASTLFSGDSSSSLRVNNMRGCLAPSQHQHHFQTPHFTTAYTPQKSVSFATANISSTPSTSSVVPTDNDLSLHDNLSVSKKCDAIPETTLLNESSPPVGLYTTLSSADLLDMHNHTVSSSHLPLSGSDLSLRQALLLRMPSDSAVTNTIASASGVSLPQKETSASGSSDKGSSPLGSNRTNSELWPTGGCAPLTVLQPQSSI